MTEPSAGPTNEPALGAAAPAIKVWTPQKIFVIVMLTVIMTSNYLDRLIMTIVQEPIKLELGISDLQLGLLTGPAFGILYALSALPIARLAERYDRITILSVSLAAWSGFTILAAAVTSYVQLLLVRMGVGISEGGGAPSVHALVSDYFSARQRGFAIAMTGLSMPLAGFIAPLAGGFIAEEYGWRMAFIAVGVPGILIALFFRLTVKDPRMLAASPKAAGSVAAARASTFMADMKWLATNKAYVTIWIATAAAASVMTASLLFTASYLLRKYGLTLREAGVVLSVGLGVGGGFGALLGGWLSDRFAGEHGRSYVIVPSIGAVGAGILYFIVFSVDTWQVAAAFVVGASIFQSLKNGPNYAAVQSLVPPHMRATSSAVLLLAISLVGSSAGPPMVGILSDWAAHGTFPAEFGLFSERCFGPTAETIIAVSEACATASAEGLATALRINAALYSVPVVLYLLAAKYIRLELDQD